MKRASRLIALGLGLLALCAAGATAQDCVNYPDYIHFVGQDATCDYAYDVVVDGNYAYVVSWGGGHSRLHVTDISTPSAPAYVTGIEIGGYGRGIALRPGAYPARRRSAAAMFGGRGARPT